MTKKYVLLEEAQRLYCVDRKPIKEIAKCLHLSEKTLRSWKKEHDWDGRRKNHLAVKRSFHEELYEFGRVLLNIVRKDLEEGKPVDANRLYTLKSIIPNLTRVKDYEEAAVAGRKPEDGKAMTPDDIIKIVQQALEG